MPKRRAMSAADYQRRTTNQQRGSADDRCVSKSEQQPVETTMKRQRQRRRKALIAPAPVVVAAAPVVTQPVVAPTVPAVVVPSGINPSGAPAAEQTELAIGFRLPADVAMAIAIRNGEPPQSLFLELVEIGEGGEWNAETAGRTQALVEMLAREVAPLIVTVSGFGRLMANEETGGKDLLYLTVDGPALDDLRIDLLDALDEGDVLPIWEHSFVPMIPIAYVDPGTPSPVEVVEKRQISLAALSVQIGAAFVDYPLLGEEQPFDPNNPAGLAALDARPPTPATTLNATPVFANKSEPAGDISSAKVQKSWCPIIKADMDRRLVTGIVLVPEIVDAQGDVIGAPVIEAAAHQFLADYNRGAKLGHMHNNFDRKLELVESYLAPVDMPIEGAVVRKGTWLITTRVVDDDVWAEVKKGVIKGFSIGGVAKARPLTS